MASESEQQDEQRRREEDDAQNKDEGANSSGGGGDSGGGGGGGGGDSSGGAGSFDYGTYGGTDYGGSASGGGDSSPNVKKLSSAGESFFDQPKETQDLFNSVWGIAQAADRWTAERNADLADSGWRTSGKSLNDVLSATRQPTWVDRTVQQVAPYGMSQVGQERQQGPTLNINDPASVQKFVNNLAFKAWQQQSGLDAPAEKDINGVKNYIESWKGMYQAGEKPIGYQQLDAALNAAKQPQPQALGYQDPSRALTAPAANRAPLVQNAVNAATKPAEDIWRSGAQSDLTNQERDYAELMDRGGYPPSVTPRPFRNTEPGAASPLRQPVPGDSAEPSVRQPVPTSTEVPEARRENLSLVRNNGGAGLHPARYSAPASETEPAPIPPDARVQYPTGGPGPENQTVDEALASMGITPEVAAPAPEAAVAAPAESGVNPIEIVAGHLLARQFGGPVPLGDAPKTIANGLVALAQGNDRGAWAKDYLDEIAATAWAIQKGLTAEEFDPRQADPAYIDAWERMWAAGETNAPLLQDLNAELKKYGLPTPAEIQEGIKQGVQPTQVGTTYRGPLPQQLVGANPAPGLVAGQSEPVDQMARIWAQAFEKTGDRDFADSMAALLIAEAGLTGVTGDVAIGGSHGPFQFYLKGELPGFRQWLSDQMGRQISIEEAAKLARNIDLATAYYVPRAYSFYQRGSARGLPNVLAIVGGGHNSGAIGSREEAIYRQAWRDWQSGNLRLPGRRPMGSI